jgi:Mn-dependent DtxR family transcriptional regulator
MGVAFVTNSPTGPAMVLVATVLFGLAVLLSPQHGWLIDRLRKRRLRRHIDGEDILKAMTHLAEAGTECTLRAMAAKTGLSIRRLASTVRELIQGGYVRRIGERLELSESGRQRARGLIRSHRLWESYLAGEARIGMENIHDVAERLEHAHELAEEVAAQLGYPERDPHGEPIPGGGSSPGR